jgi:hypothetical protein
MIRFLQRSNLKSNIQENNKFVTKKNFMLALFSKVLKLIKLKVKSEKEEGNSKIGFIFFNENIFLACDGSNPDFPIIIDKNYNVDVSFDINKMLAK